MDMPEVHALNFALLYDPPTLVMQYYLGDDRKTQFAHKVRVTFDNDTTVGEIADELIDMEMVYFNPKVVPRKKLEHLIQLLMDNKGRKIGKLKLAPTPFEQDKPEQLIELTEESKDDIMLEPIGMDEPRDPKPKEMSKVRPPPRIKNKEKSPRLSPEESKKDSRKKKSIRERMGLKHIANPEPIDQPEDDVYVSPQYQLGFDQHSPEEYEPPQKEIPLDERFIRQGQDGYNLNGKSIIENRGNWCPR